MLHSLTRIWYRVWSLWSWSWKDRKTFWLSHIRLSWDVCWRISWTKAQVSEIAEIRIDSRSSCRETLVFGSFLLYFVPRLLPIPNACAEVRCCCNCLSDKKPQLRPKTPLLLHFCFFAAETPKIKTPLHSIIKLSPAAYGCRVEEIIVPIEAVDDERLSWSSSRCLRKSLSLTSSCCSLVVC